MRDQSPFKSEADFIAWIRRRTPPRAAGLTLGIGDDAALVTVPPGQELILTTDMTIENVHFRAESHSARAVGHRALARSLSDIAAMGGTPRYALISLAVSGRTARAWLEGFYNGLFALARRFSVAVIGGDTALVAGPTAADVVVAGTVPRGRALRRSGAKVGDRIFVSGRLGLAALGLRLLMGQLHGQTSIEKSALHAHLSPQPQCALGQFLSRCRLASAMMDISDGLSIDLQRLCEASGVGATLFAEQIPAPSLAEPEDALALALHGGEDYQLLFTARKDKKIPKQFDNIPLTCIGEITRLTGLRIVDSSGKTPRLETKGYDHFRRT